MYRVVNEDLSFMSDNEKEIIGKFNTLDEAMKCEADNYFFNTTVEQLIDGEWKLTLINGQSIVK